MKKNIEKLNIPEGIDIHNTHWRNELKINEIIDYLNNQANGETPEVDNTVGQKLMEDYVLYVLRTHTKEAYPKDSIGEAKLLGHIMYIIQQFKPVETDKEYPIVIWKLHTKYTSGNSKSPILFFKGTVKELKSYIESVHLNKNIGFIITDFENLG